MKQRSGMRELSVGVTLALALVVLAALITMVGREGRILRSRATYTTTVANSLGLKDGSPVLMGGVQVGTVTQISLPADLAAGGIEVEMGVNREFTPRIRQGSLTSVGFITLLSGEKYIDISSGDPNRQALPSGSRIPPDTAATLLETGQNLAENVATVATQVRELLDEIGRGESLVGRLVKSKDPYLGQGVIEKMEATLDRTNHLLARIDAGQGVLGRLVDDQPFADETLGAIRSAAVRLDRTLESVESGRGGLAELLREDGQGRQAIEDLRHAAASLRATAEKLEADTGLLGRLLNDREYSEQVATDLRNISSNLSSILEKIDEGEGTLGGFVNDPSVYEGVQNIVRGINKSRTAKFLLRHYGKKGAKEAAREKTPPKLDAEREAETPSGQDAPREAGGGGPPPPAPEPGPAGPQPPR